MKLHFLVIATAAVLSTALVADRNLTAAKSNNPSRDQIYGDDNGAAYVDGQQDVQSAEKGKNQCTNPSLSWTINSSYTDGGTNVTYTGQIQGDRSGAYVDGTSGVVTVMHVCGGSNDATLTLSSPRSASVIFGPQLDPAVAPPSFACNGCTVTGEPMAWDLSDLGLNWSPSTSATNYNFTTGFNANVPVSSGTYGLHLLSPSSDVPDTLAQWVNPPYTTYDDSVVHVQHCPAGSNQGSMINPVNPYNECPTLAKETWFVWPDATTAPPQIATLLNQKRSPGVNAGQFSMPFFFTITLK